MIVDGKLMRNRIDGAPLVAAASGVNQMVLEMYLCSDINLEKNF